MPIGGWGEVFESTKQFWSFRGKQHSSQIQAWSRVHAPSPQCSCQRGARRDQRELAIAAEARARAVCVPQREHSSGGGYQRKCLSVVFLSLKKWSPFTSIELDYSATLCTLRLKVFCALKQSTHPSVGIVVSR